MSKTLWAITDLTDIARYRLWPLEAATVGRCKGPNDLDETSSKHPTRTKALSEPFQDGEALR